MNTAVVPAGAVKSFAHVTVRTENWERHSFSIVNAYLGDDDRVTMKYANDYLEIRREP